MEPPLLKKLCSFNKDDWLILIFCWRRGIVIVFDADCEMNNTLTHWGQYQIAAIL